MMGLSLSRLVAMMLKEIIHMRRDRVTFAFAVTVPILQLLIFGYAVNSDPKGLPAAIVAADQGQFTRSIIAAMENSRYFRFVAKPDSEAEAERLLRTGEVQFVVHVPADFSRRIARGERPSLLVEADATDPAATSNALGAMIQLATTALQNDLTGALARPATDPPIDLVVHRRWNPEGITQYNVVPGLIGVVLTMTMVLMTALAVTREREAGTLESLLAMPVTPVEVMLGTLIPYIFIGYVQVAVIVVAAKFLFDVPILGSFVLLGAVLFLFIAVNLAIGFTFSTLSQTQMQAAQLANFFLLPSILMSGFAFPFKGMPEWAQVIGECLPTTHFLRVVRAILLKGNGFGEIWPDLWPLFLALVVVSATALLRYRRTLD